VHLILVVLDQVVVDVPAQFADHFLEQNYLKIVEKEDFCQCPYHFAQRELMVELGLCPDSGNDN
jgi:hypothetical protein